SRALLELLAAARPRLTEGDRALWREFERRAQALDRRERELSRCRATGGTNEAIGKMEAAWDRSRKAFEATRQNVLERVEGTRTLQAMDVPAPRKVVRALRALAGAAAEPTRR